MIFHKIGYPKDKNMTFMQTFTTEKTDDKIVCLVGVILKESKENYHVKLNTGELGKLPKSMTKIIKTDIGYHKFILERWVAVKHIKRIKEYDPLIALKQ